MTEKFYLENEFIRQNAINMLKRAPLGYVVEVKAETRTAAQNRKLWPMLTDISKQVCWHGRWLKKEDWKVMLTAALGQEEPVQGITIGTMVLLGESTSNMSKERFIKLIELIYAFGSEKDVIWSRGAIDVFEVYLSKNKGVM